MNNNQWKFDIYGNARNLETNELYYIELAKEGYYKVCFNNKPIASFTYINDAQEFIKTKVVENN